VTDENARALGKRRWAGRSLAERSAHGRMMARARWGPREAQVGGAKPGRAIGPRPHDGPGQVGGLSQSQGGYLKQTPYARTRGDPPVLA
jgi:hypothetical protein